jgi:hypothetical protein
MNEGPGRAARIPSQRRCKSDRVLPFGELEQFTKTNPSKNGRKRKLDIETKSATDSDASSDSDTQIRIIFLELNRSPLKVLPAWQH